MEFGGSQFDLRTCRLCDHRTQRSTRKPREASAQPESLRVQLARSLADYVGAFGLLQRRYAEAGLSDAGRPLRVERFHFWRQSQVIVAKRGQRVVGCLTLIRPGHRLQLPLQIAHPDVFAELPYRHELAEVTCLAIDRKSRSPEVFIGLSRMAQRFALSQGVNRFVVVVHPHHAGFYRRANGFEVVRDDLKCARVNGKPGVVMLGQIDAPGKGRRQWRSLYGMDQPNENGLDPRLQIRPRPMTKAQQAFFAPYVCDWSMPTPSDASALWDSAHDRRSH